MKENKINYLDCIRRTWYQRQDRTFDKKHNIVTDLHEIYEILPGSENRFDKQSFERGGHSKGYQACYVRNIKESIKKARKFLPIAKVFYDVGSGTGRALFVARIYHNFDEVIGIENLPVLHDVALANIKESKKTNIKSILGDASHFIIEKLPSVIFMFNPFDEIILRKFLSNNIQIIKSSASVIIYVNDIHDTVLSEFGLLQRYENKLRKISIWQ